MIMPPVIGHRGASQYAPENTLSAFKKAKSLGVKWIEFDVQMTSDHELVIFHDYEISRTTNGKGKIQDYTLNQLKNLDAGSWFGPSFKGEKILTFQELILFIQKEGMAANIEIKVQAMNVALMAKTIVTQLEENLKTKSFPFFISSFNTLVLEKIKEINSSFPVAHLMEKLTDDWSVLCDKLNCVAIDLRYDIIDEVIIKEILASGRLVLVFTVNDPEFAKKLFSWGVSAVFSDCPDKILSVL